MINERCYVFEKDIKDLVTCGKDVLVVNVDRSEFIPIITQNAEYSVKEACETYLKHYKSSLSLVETKNCSVFNS